MNQNAINSQASRAFETTYLLDGRYLLIDRLWSQTPFPDVNSLELGITYPTQELDVPRSTIVVSLCAVYGVKQGLWEAARASPLVQYVIISRLDSKNRSKTKDRLF